MEHRPAFEMFTEPKEAARSLAPVIAGGKIEAAMIVVRCSRALGRRPRWLSALAKKLVAVAEGRRFSVWRIRRWLLLEPSFLRACGKELIHVAPQDRPPSTMCPANGAPSTWPVPQLATLADLARELQQDPADLEWMAGLRRSAGERPDGPLHHYSYRLVRKRDGSHRLIESPKLRLKFLQRRILAMILEKIPPHSAAHGFRHGRSIHSFAAPHVAKAFVLRLDLRDFFASVHRARVLAIFLTAGYPEPVASLLAGICTHQTPRSILRGWAAVDSPLPAPQTAIRWTCPHLPQGAPTSPALANLAAYRLDRRLAGLAAVAGADYTRYADDLVFSGNERFRRGASGFVLRASAIALEEGFEVNTRKTRFMPRGVRQQAAGIVLNQHPNVDRVAYDRLKATLHNCRRFGASGQNRDGHPDFPAHLAGRIAHVNAVNPPRGAKLRHLFDQIEWD